MGRPKKDKFDDLDAEFKDSVASMAVDEIRMKIAQVALNEEENLKAKEDDEDLLAKKEAAKFAGEQYAEASKMNRLRIRFMRRILGDRGNL